MGLSSNTISLDYFLNRYRTASFDLPTLKEILDDSKEWKTDEEIEEIPMKNMTQKMNEIIEKLKFHVQNKKDEEEDERKKTLPVIVQTDNFATNSSTKPKRSSDDQAEESGSTEEPQERLFPMTEDFWKIFEQKFSEFKTLNGTFQNKPTNLSSDANGTLTQTANGTQTSGINDFFRALLKDDKLRQTVDDVANLATKNHVAILKTYGVDERLDKSGKFPNVY